MRDMVEGTGGGAPVLVVAVDTALAATDGAVVEAVLRLEDTQAGADVDHACAWLASGPWNAGAWLKKGGDADATLGAADTPVVALEAGAASATPPLPSPGGEGANQNPPDPRRLSVEGSGAGTTGDGFPSASEGAPPVVGSTGPLSWSSRRLTVAGAHDVWLPTLGKLAEKSLLMLARPPAPEFGVRSLQATLPAERGASTPPSKCPRSDAPTAFAPVAWSVPLVTATDAIETDWWKSNPRVATSSQVSLHMHATATRQNKTARPSTREQKATPQKRHSNAPWHTATGTPACSTKRERTRADSWVVQSRACVG